MIWQNGSLTGCAAMLRYKNNNLNAETSTCDSFIYFTESGQSTHTWAILRPSTKHTHSRMTHIHTHTHTNTLARVTSSYFASPLWSYDRRIASLIFALNGRLDNFASPGVITNSLYFFTVRYINLLFPWLFFTRGMLRLSLCRVLRPTLSRLYASAERRAWGWPVVTMLCIEHNSKNETNWGADNQSSCFSTWDIWSYFLRPEITLAAKLKTFCNFKILDRFAQPYTWAQ